MNDTIETTLLLNLFYFENGTYTRNENFIEAKRRKAIALLDEDADELKSIDSDLAEEYQETISYLDSLSDEDYQSLKEELLQQVEVN
ncbi:transcriptional regulator [Streptococcus oralis]|uniref:transcriptional regulator n=1 Tax=Streptococcus oralis TaxID=1303 RepID=UPI002023D7DF|nr:transcriptional regulator [Streptococcus oralis]URK66774.1 transcriptional regulator [Streptococcus oralis]URK67128.1 transcriptional regulator [Streptococcus oralis]